jgi:uncharacterized repeat protein (TIGR03803 family)
MLAHWAHCLLAVLGLAVPLFAQAQTATVSTVLAMSGSRNPDGVTLGPDGALYGAAASQSPITGGLVFRVAPDGTTVDTVYQFRGTDGVAPAGALLLGSDSLFYGTAEFSNGGILAGGGTVFRIAADGTGFTRLHQFKGSGSNNVNNNPISDEGVSPTGALIEGSDGFLYGVARYGGPAGTGTLYKIDKAGSGFAVLHAFGDVTSGSSATIVNADGAHPRAALVQRGDYLYGTTNAGGANGQGTIFRLKLDGADFRCLHAFATADGAAPRAGLTDGGDGLLYGTTSAGGANSLGVLYSIAPDSIEPPDPVEPCTGSTPTTLYDFVAGEGSEPTGTLLLASDGRLYGTTNLGGTTSSGSASTIGTVFSYEPASDVYTKLYNFENTTGANPNGRLVQLNTTEFLGTTTSGGRCGNGTVFRLSLAGTTVSGDTTCGENSGGGGGGGAMGWLMLLLLAMLLPVGAVHCRTTPSRRALPSGSANTSEAQRLSQSAPRARSPRTM